MLPKATPTNITKEIVEYYKKMPPKEQLEAFVRLLKASKANKEMMHYFMFESKNKNVFIDKACGILRDKYAGSRRDSTYLFKKNFQELCKRMNAFLKLDKDAIIHVELRLYVLQLVGADLQKIGCEVADNLYQRILKKVVILLATLHPDYALDYTAALKEANKLQKKFMILDEL